VGLTRAYHHHHHHHHHHYHHPIYAYIHTYMHTYTTHTTHAPVVGCFFVFFFPSLSPPPPITPARHRGSADKSKQRQMQERRWERIKIQQICERGAGGGHTRSSQKQTDRSIEGKKERKKERKEGRQEGRTANTHTQSQARPACLCVSLLISLIYLLFRISFRLFLLFSLHGPFRHGLRSPLSPHHLHRLGLLPSALIAPRPLILRSLLLLPNRHRLILPLPLPPPILLHPLLLLLLLPRTPPPATPQKTKEGRVGRLRAPPLEEEGEGFLPCGVGLDWVGGPSQSVYSVDHTKPNQTGRPPSPSSSFTPSQTSHT
jgi:hypothetical protein